jgi:hypothetical protein
MTRRKLRLLSAATVAAGAIASTLVVLPAAEAATYDGQSAFVTGCANTGEIARSASIYDFNGAYLGAVYLWYSTACRTVWAETYSVNGYQPGVAWGADARVTRNSDGASEGSMSSFSGQHAVYTLMLNDANVTSYAFGDIDNSITFLSATTGSF